MDDLSELYEAISHPLRREIIKMLKKRKMKFSEILSELDLKPGTFGYHLEKMKDLVKSTEDGYILTEKGNFAYDLILSGEKGVRKKEVSGSFFLPFFRIWKQEFLEEVYKNPENYLYHCFFVYTFCILTSFIFGSKIHTLIFFGTSHDTGMQLVKSSVLNTSFFMLYVSIGIYILTKFFNKKADFLKIFVSVTLSEMILVPILFLSSRFLFETMNMLENFFLFHLSTLIVILSIYILLIYFIYYVFIIIRKNTSFQNSIFIILFIFLIFPGIYNALIIPYL